MLVTRWLLDDVPSDGNPLEELSKAFLHRSASTAAKYDEKREDKGQFLLKQVKTGGAEGVIFAAPSFCDPALLERPMLQDVLSKHGVPHTASLVVLRLAYTWLLLVKVTHSWPVVSRSSEIDSPPPLRTTTGPTSRVYFFCCGS